MKTITLTPDASGMVDWPTLSNDKKSVVTIGSFDGMHQGHQAVIRRVAEIAGHTLPGTKAPEKAICGVHVPAPLVFGPSLIPGGLLLPLSTLALEPASK